jgi:hypothetical protein
MHARHIRLYATNALYIAFPCIHYVHPPWPTNTLHCLSMHHYVHPPWANQGLLPCIHFPSSYPSTSTLFNKYSFSSYTFFLSFLVTYFPLSLIPINREILEIRHFTFILRRHCKKTLKDPNHREKGKWRHMVTLRIFQLSQVCIHAYMCTRMEIRLFPDQRRAVTELGNELIDLGGTIRGTMGVLLRLPPWRDNPGGNVYVVHVCG